MSRGRNPATPFEASASWPGDSPRSAYVQRAACKRNQNQTNPNGKNYGVPQNQTKPTTPLQSNCTVISAWATSAAIPDHGACMGALPNEPKNSHAISEMVFGGALATTQTGRLGGPFRSRAAGPKFRRHFGSTFPVPV